jgi:hypothetical protein
LSLLVLLEGAKHKFSPFQTIEYHRLQDGLRTVNVAHIASQSLYYMSPLIHGTLEIPAERRDLLFVPAKFTQMLLHFGKDFLPGMDDP